MKVAMVVPTLTKDARRADMEKHNARIWRKQVDELIILEDGGLVDEELAKIAHIYIYHWDNLGPCNNMNMGWQLAHARGADFVVIADSDVELIQGTVRELCDPLHVVVPTVAQHPTSAAFIAPMLCVPRIITEKIGMYDDRGGAHRNESFDADLGNRYRIYDPLLITKCNEVIIHHEGGATRFDHPWQAAPQR